MAQDSFFTDAAAYEQRMGRWTLAVGALFLDWIAPPASVRWLDVGCGTGVFTQLILDRCSPARMFAVDASKAQIELARNKPVAHRVDFRVADARALPFADDAFEVVVSALVINFIPDRPQALAEMRRVGSPRGLIAGYVWDYAADRSMSSPVRVGLRQFGVELPPIPGTEDSRLEVLSSLFAGAGLEDIATRTIDVTMSFPDFDEFWRMQTPSYNPAGKAVASLSDADRRKLMDVVRKIAPARSDGSIHLSVRANAVKAHVSRSKSAGRPT